MKPSGVVRAEGDYSMDDDPRGITVHAALAHELPAHQHPRLTRVITNMLHGRQLVCDLVVPPDLAASASAPVNAQRTTMPEPRDHAEYCRNRAQECRQLAEVATSQSVRQSYLRLARSYDAFAIE